MRRFIISLLAFACVIATARAQDVAANGDTHCGVHVPEDHLQGVLDAEDWAKIAQRETMGRRMLGVQCTGAPLTRADLTQVRLQRVVAGQAQDVDIAVRLLTGPGMREANRTPRPGDQGAGFSIYAPMRPYAQSGLFNRQAASYRLVGGPFTAPYVIEDWDDAARRSASSGLSGSVLQGDKDGLGVRLEGQWVMLADTRFGGVNNLVVAANARGEIASSDPEIESFSRAFELGVSVSKFAMLGPAGAVQLELTPIEIESDQEGEAVVGRSTLGATMRVPYTNRLAASIARAFGAGCAQATDAANCVNAGMFVSADIGASYQIASPDGRDAAGASTWGASLYYQFPLSTNWDVTLEAGVRDDGGDDGQRTNHTISLRYFLNCPRRAAFTLSYVDGEFSPLGDQVEGLRAGLTAILGQMGRPRDGNPMGCEG